MIKVVTLFLVFIMILAILGRLRLPKFGRSKSTNCGNCGRPKIGRGPCPCEGKE